MPRPKDDIVIQEPAVEEIGRRHSCLKRTCLSGCGCIVFLVVGALAIINFATQERERDLKEIPSSVQSTVPLYDRQNVDTIKMIEGDERSKGIELAALIPKVIVSPLIVTFPEKFLENPKTGQGAALENIKTFLKLPVSNHNDTIILEWDNLPARPNFMKAYYTTELEKRGFDVEMASDTESVIQLTFKKNAIDGAILIQDTTPQKEGTDVVSMRVNMEVQ